MCGRGVSFGVHMNVCGGRGVQERQAHGGCVHESVCVCTGCVHGGHVCCGCGICMSVNVTGYAGISAGEQGRQRLCTSCVTTCQLRTRLVRVSFHAHRYREEGG